MQLPFNFSWPSPAYLFGAIVFGIVGIAAFRYGRKNEQPRAVWIGLALMLYPYLFSNTAWLYVIGALLCAALFVGRG